jgi:hypothetical protein
MGKWEKITLLKGMSPVCFVRDVPGLYSSVGYPPPPLPLNALTGVGFAKMLCKILSRKRLEVKILTTNPLFRNGKGKYGKLGHAP